MAAQAGRKLKLSMGDGASPVESFVVIGGFEMLAMGLERPMQDASHTQSGAWRLLAEGAGQARLRIEGQGVFEDSAAEEALRAAAFDGAGHHFRLEHGNGDVLAGTFVVERYGRTGRVGELERFSMVLQNSGAVSFVSA